MKFKRVGKANTSSGNYKTQIITNRYVFWSFILFFHCMISYSLFGLHYYDGSTGSNSSSSSSSSRVILTPTIIGKSNININNSDDADDDNNNNNAVSATVSAKTTATATAISSNIDYNTGTETTTTATTTYETTTSTTSTYSYSYSSSLHQSQVVIPEVVKQGGRRTVILPVQNTNTIINSNTGSGPSSSTIKIQMSNECVQRQNDVKQICTEFFEKEKCQTHDREIPKQQHERGILQKLRLTTTTASSNTITSTTSTNNQCRTLWFAGFHEGSMSRCNEKGYRFDYATALSSWNMNAIESLQPVLLLGRYGLNNTEEISALRKYAIEYGAIIVTVDHLSFQDDIVKWHDISTTEMDFLMGPYMRLDIPTIIQKHNLFHLPGICQQHILYTDADIMFVNKISYNDVQDLILEMSKQTIQHGISVKKYRYDDNAFLMYGREVDINHPLPLNTGVMVMDVMHFQQTLPKMIQFRNTHPNQEQFVAFDQGWFNLYFEENIGVSLLPLYWNWKLYWKLEPSVYTDIKIVHFHGPKPATGLRKMSSCELGTTIQNSESIYVHAAYMPLVLNCICCDDSAKTASYVLQLYDQLKPSIDDVC